MQTNEAYCHLLAVVLSADGVVTDVEHNVLKEAMTRLGLDDEARARVQQFQGDPEAEKVMLREPAEARQALVDALVEAALSDGKLTPAETAEVKRIATAIGL